MCVSLSSYINRKSSICDHLSPSTLIVFLLPRKKKLILSFFFFFIVIWVFACAPKRQLLPLVIKDETMYEYQWCSLTFFSRLYEKPSLRFDCCSESLSNNIDSMTMIKILNGLETTNILPIWDVVFHRQDLFFARLARDNMVVFGLICEKILLFMLFSILIFNSQWSYDW